MAPTLGPQWGVSPFGSAGSLLPLSIRQLAAVVSPRNRVNTFRPRMWCIAAPYCQYVRICCKQAC